MKWRDRGHEFDELGAVFQQCHEILIYAIDGVATSAAARLAFLDKDIRLLTPRPGCGSGLGKLRTAANWLWASNRQGLECLAEEAAGKIFLLPKCFDKDGELLNQLLKAGFRWNRTVFWLEEFMRQYLPVYALYVKNQVYFPDVSFIPSTKCNLRCKHCLNFTPFLKKMHDEPIERLKAEIDLYFSKINYTGMFHISGGEPLLYPHLEELLSYIGANYRTKMYELAFTTNGTQKISDSICDTIKKYSVHVICDDYTSTLKNMKGKYKELIKRLKEKSIKYRINKVRKWIDLAPEITDNSSMSEEELISFCENCSVPWCEYFGGRIYSCNYAHYGEKAGLTFCDSTEYLDLTSVTENQKKELVEFRIGYTEKGYMEFCKRCAGFNNNPYKRQPAEQC